MHRHPHLDLLLHDEKELTPLIGESLVERSTLHECPLACAERLVNGDSSAGNLFILPKGYQLIDWQFPKLAPFEAARRAKTGRTGGPR